MKKKNRRCRMSTEPRPPVSHRKLGIFGVVALIGAALMVATGIRAREDSSARLREWTDHQAVSRVDVALPNAKALNPTIDLPGRLEAHSRAPIFARVSGYLKSWSVDIGARVKAGDVIFSSRRRHTRFDCDWSSDVCSSDLRALNQAMATCGSRASARPLRVTSAGRLLA